MSVGDNLGYNVSTLKSYFRGGVRKSILTIGGVSILLTIPIYFLGGYASVLYKNFWYKGNNIVQDVSKNTRDYTIGQTQILPLSNGKQDLYVPIDNKTNTKFGLYPWVYSLQILDKNNAIISQNNVSSYLLPGATSYIVASNVDPEGVKINIVKDAQTIETPYNPSGGKIMQEPNIIITSTSVSPKEESDGLNIRAVLKNNDIVAVGKVDILYLLRDSRQSVVGIGTAAFGGFLPNTEREIIISYPKPKNKEAKFVEVRWSTNYLDKNNITI